MPAERPLIEAMIFDLDGTLVRTERLKAISYARAAVRLCPRDITEAEVIEAFKDVVGLSRREVALALVERFGLEERARQLPSETAAEQPWQAYVRLRLKIYNGMLADPATLFENQWPHNMQLLRAARMAGCRTALATMSSRVQAARVLDVLGLAAEFDFVAAREDVVRGKPDPEIYRLVSSQLGVAAEKCLVIEDSPAGVEAALAAGMAVIAVSTPFTKQRLHASGLLAADRIVDEPRLLVRTVEQIAGVDRI